MDLHLPNCQMIHLISGCQKDIQAEQQHIQKHGWKSRKAGNIPGITVMSGAGACVEGIGVGSSCPEAQQWRAKKSGLYPGGRVGSLECFQQGAAWHECCKLLLLCNKLPQNLVAWHNLFVMITSSVGQEMSGSSAVKAAMVAAGATRSEDSFPE